MTLDTTRADHLGAYDYALPTSPEFDRLASRSILFERAYSTSNWTRPAVASLMTSTLPSRHGVIDYQYALPETLELLTESLHWHGYRTAVFAANPNVEPEDGYSRGTDHYVQYSNRGILGRSFLFLNVLNKDLKWLARGISAAVSRSESSPYDPQSLTTRAIRWLSEESGASFAYLHFTGPHKPYLPPLDVLRELGGKYVNERLANPPSVRAGEDALTYSDSRQMVLQYDAEIRWHDREIARLVSYVEGRSAQRDQVLVVMADHGEAFGENGIWAHGASLYDEVARIPLLIWCSKPCGRPRRVTAPVSLIDVAPTMLALAGISRPEQYEGVNLLPVLRGERLDRGLAVISENPNTRERSIRTKDWLLIQGRHPGHPIDQLKSVRREVPGLVGADRQELRDQLVANLEQRLATSQSLTTTQAEIELSDERIGELQALGYLD